MVSIIIADTAHDGAFAYASHGPIADRPASALPLHRWITGRAVAAPGGSGPGDEATEALAKKRRLPTLYIHAVLDIHH